MLPFSPCGRRWHRRPPAAVLRKERRCLHRPWARSGSETDEGSASAERTPHPPSLSRRHLLPQGEKEAKHRTTPSPPARHTPRIYFAPASPTRGHTRTPTQLETIVVEHPRLRIHGPLRFSVATLTGAASALALACAGAAAGHRNIDFEITVLPAYQHFRPSIRRQDQCPCAFDGEATHCLICVLACAVSMPIGTSAEMQMAKKKTGRICIFIGHSPCG